MIIYVLRRLLIGASVLLAAIALTFGIFFLGPSDPAGTLCGDRNCTAQRLEQIKEDLGLNEPVTSQFGEYVKGLAVGTDRNGRHCDAPCLGWSYSQNRPVRDMVQQALPVTASIVLGSMFVYSFFGLLVGTLAARNRGSPADRFLIGSSQIITAIPYFVLAQLFYLYFMVFNPIWTRSGWTPLTENPWDWFKGLSGVWFFYGIVQAAIFVRYVRASMIDVQSQDYVRTARSKGLTERQVTIRHTLRASLGPFLTLLGLNVAQDMAGAIFTENIFDLPGMGRLALQSFDNGDLPVIAGIVIVTATFIILMNILIDILYGVVDPRVKLS